MNIVNGFDIDTVEGAKAYLKSEGVDIAAFVKKGIADMTKMQALDLANVVGTFFCQHKLVLDCKEQCHKCKQQPNS